RLLPVDMEPRLLGRTGLCATPVELDAGTTLLAKEFPSAEHERFHALPLLGEAQRDFAIAHDDRRGLVGERHGCGCTRGEHGGGDAREREQEPGMKTG